MAQHREPLLIEVRPQDGGGACLRVRGDLDSATSGELRAALDEQRSGGRDVVLDLAEVRFIDSTGLRVLVDAARAANNGTSVSLIDDLPGHVRRVMAITGTLGMIPLIRR